MKRADLKELMQFHNIIWAVKCCVLNTLILNIKLDTFIINIMPKLTILKIINIDWKANVILFCILIFTGKFSFLGSLKEQEINTQKDLLTFEKFLHNPCDSKSKVLPNFLK